MAGGSIKDARSNAVVGFRAGSTTSNTYVLVLVVRLATSERVLASTPLRPSRSAKILPRAQLESKQFEVNRSM